MAEIDTVEEGRFVDGCWVAGHRLNGDERLRLLLLNDVGLVRVTLLSKKK